MRKTVCLALVLVLMCSVFTLTAAADAGTGENLFTGTRYLNAGTMLQFEMLVCNYIEKTGNHVIDRVTPPIPR